MSKKDADSICRQIELLLNSVTSSIPIPRETIAWLEDIGPELRQRLAATGLIPTQRLETLKGLLDEFVLNREDVKPATLEVWQQPARNLVEYFGADRSLRSISPGDAEKFARWLGTQKLAPSTVAKRIAFARTFFHTARKNRLIEENPFAEVKGPVADVRGRQSFVTREMMNQLLRHANPEWRIILTLARYGGLRCPSEVLSLRWEDIDWDRGRMVVQAPKTERYAGKATREIPLFPELNDYLQEARGRAEAGQIYVVGGNFRERANRPTGWKNCNIRTSFGKLIKRAGLEQWPRMFHNLRSSRETELLEDFPVHVVAAWMGHAVQVSLKHYAQITDDHFLRAVEKPDVKSDVK
ncbi:tyrosine-type recombinase/integrase [Tuwongella immobilis]|nr:site-specific integrase [Tuwongella immobilis]